MQSIFILSWQSNLINYYLYTILSNDQRDIFLINIEFNYPDGDIYILYNHDQLMNLNGYKCLYTNTSTEKVYWLDIYSCP